VAIDGNEKSDDKRIILPDLVVINNGINAPWDYGASDDMEWSRTETLGIRDTNKSRKRGR
jgi:hypothetical protein